MPISLSPHATKRLHGSIKRYFAEHLNEDIGDLKAAMMLDFCLREVGPSIYNQAIADAQTYFGARVLDVEGVCHEPEFSYWKGKS
jgi:uncharacterized protein (DUF2164 family)